MNADGYQEVSKIMGHSDSPGLRRILEYMMTEQQARLIAALPGTYEELAKKVNTDVETIKNISKDLYKKGVIVPKNFETLERTFATPRLSEAIICSRSPFFAPSKSLVRIQYASRDRNPICWLSASRAI